MAEVGVPRPGGDGEHVVVERPALAVRQIVDLHGPRLEIEARHLAEHDVDVALPAQRLPERDGDLDRGERAGRDLVDERLEEKEVLPVDERHLDVGTAEPAGREQPAESAADDDDPFRHARIAPSSCSSFSFMSSPPA